MATPNNNTRINYYNKDFSKIREDLFNYAKTYFPTTGNDFSPASPGTMFIEMTAYVGDLLSFYIDKQIQETYIQTATERENIIQIANMLGYTHKNITPAATQLSLYQLVPGTGSGAYPDLDYAMTIKANSLIGTSGGVTFRTLTDVNFAMTSSLGASADLYQDPYWLLKQKVMASAGSLITETFYFPQNTQPNPSIKINRTDVIEIMDVVDSRGYVWYEVPYLAQQTILQLNENNASMYNVFSAFERETPYLLNYILTNKKFVKKVNVDNTTELMFGSGVAIDADSILFANQETINSGFETTAVNNRALDPTNFLYMKANGEVPSDVTLTVRYYAGGGFQSNVSAGSITELQSIQLGEMNSTGLNSGILTFVQNSITATNEEPAQGGREAESDEEIRQNAMAYFNAQNRCVTAQDYMIRTLALPQKLGSIAKVFAIRDDQIHSSTPIVNTYTPTQPPAGGGRAIDTEIGNSTPTTAVLPTPPSTDNPMAINLYCLAYDSAKNFVKVNAATKYNLTQYLGFYRMLGDSLNLMDAYIINIGVDFSIVVLKNYNQNEVLLRCILALKDYFNNDNMQINKPIIMSEIYNLISLVNGVQSVPSVKVTNKVGGNYSNASYEGGITAAFSPDGGIIYPAADASIFEIKFPNQDITGRVVNY